MAPGSFEHPLAAVLVALTVAVPVFIVTVNGLNTLPVSSLIPTAIDRNDTSVALLNTTCNSTTNVKADLFGFLMAVQNRRFEPKDGVSTPVDVALYPLRLIDVDDAKGRLQVDFTIRLYWSDHRLEWNSLVKTSCPQNFNDSDYLNVDFKDVWTPQFAIAEASLTNQQNQLETSFQLMNIKHDGTVRYRGRFQSELMCAMSLRYFPFDQQICSATVVGPFVAYRNHWRNTSNVLSYYYNQVYETKVYGREMSTNHWELNPTEEKLIASISMPATRNTSNETVISFKLYLTRNPWQHVLTWVIPPCLLTSISVAGLYCGCSTEERFGFGSAIIVTLSVLINQLHEKLAASRDGLPLLNWLYLGLFANFILATVTSNMPQAIARRIVAKRGTVRPAKPLYHDRYEERKQTGSWRPNKEQQISFVFAGAYLSIQAALILYVAIMWRTGSSASAAGRG